jgi:hypothetical protein
MAIKSNIDSTRSSREQYKREVTLLSHGYTNQEAFPDGLITVYPWDSHIDEWVRKNARSKESSSMFMLRLVEQLADFNGCSLDDFVVGDVSTVILIARAIRQNNVVAYIPRCPFCSSDNDEEVIKVPDDLEKMGEKSKDYPGFDEITLPVSKDVLNIRPLVVGDVRRLDGRNSMQKKQVADELASTLASIIDIGGGKPDSLDELLVWHKALHPQDQTYLDKAVEALSPHLSTDIKHTCDTCGRDFTKTLPLRDKEFFR